MRNELQAVLNTVRDLMPDELPALLGELEVLRTTALLRLSAPSTTQPHDELLSVESAAERMSVSTDYLYRRADTLPFTRRMGRKLLFSSLGIDRYIREKGSNNVLTARQHKRIIQLSDR
jgi:hypothetical protein